ncbi:hypothetical protein OOM74_000015 [Salmonella enterica]|nr:hypothetical protein [Salmonella enterica]
MTLKQTGPEDYKRLFEETAGGPEILDGLVRRFGGRVYVSGGHDADRQTCFNAGQRAVLDFILLQIDKANGVTDDVEE